MENKRKRRQLVVTYFNNITHYFPVNNGWRIDGPSRMIVVGHGVPRTMIPLDSVASVSIENYSRI
jgi:hypothetical protein